jgi:hypothetical protein
MRVQMIRTARWWHCSILVCLCGLAAAKAQAQSPFSSPAQTSALASDIATAPPPAPDQPQPRPAGNAFVSFFRDAEWYFSWGYNKEFWSNTDIHVSQPGLGNDFTIHDVQGQDELQQLGDIFTTSLFGPQYNFRIGRFINDSFGVELNFDHTKYTTIVGQTANVTGGIGGTPVNGPYQLTNAFFSEVLHNGANHLMINGVYRSPLVEKLNETSSLAFIGKAGAGVMLPHTTDTILGNTNNVGDKTFSNSFGLTNGWWQLNGWTAGAELGLRYVVWKPVYLELTDKVAYSYFGDLPAYQGTLQQSLWMNEIILSVGFTYDGTSK